MIENNVFDILTKKSYYTRLISKKAKFSNNSLVLKRDFSLNEDQLRKVFLLPHMVCSKAYMYVKAFQYKVLKVHLTPKYVFGLNKSLHLFETHCAFLPLFSPNLDFLQAVKVTKSSHHLLHDGASKGYGSIPG